MAMTELAVSNPLEAFPGADEAPSLHELDDLIDDVRGSLRGKQQGDKPFYFLHAHTAAIELRDADP